MTNNQSTFTKEFGYLVDQFDELQDMRWSDLQYLDEYQELKMKKNDGEIVDQGRLDLLENRFKNKIVTSARWNKFQNALLGMQGFIKVEVQDYVLNKQNEMNAYVDLKKQETLDYVNLKKDEITTTSNNAIITIDTKKQETLDELGKFTYRGAYNKNTQYYQWNTVKFRGNMYLCLVDSANNEPTNQNYWVKIADNGDAVKWRGTWSQVIQYKHLDMVIYDNAVYMCVLDNFNKLPETENSYWNLIITNRNDVKNQYYTDYKDGGFTLEHNLNEFPLIQAITKNTYGHGGYGLFTTNSRYQLNNIVEYVDSNKIKIYFVEKFKGMATLQQLSSRKFKLSYTGEDEDIEIHLR